ncbi:MAG: hypothetical protein DRJ15_16175 [Bacteroidetes bacterium]|nr:MAG: hypothetical protein DRJ15_16175 [Bacteroidota bacterium]
MTNTTKQLKGLFNLDHNIKLYIPSTIDIDKKIDPGIFIDDTLELFSNEFGGATSYNAMGAWNSKIKGLVVEKVVIVEAFATADQVEASIEKIVSWAVVLKKSMNQEAISLEYDNKLYFI